MICPDWMIFMYGIYNNILNHGTSILRVYQEDSRMWELYQEFFGVRTKQSKMAKLRCMFSHKYIFLNSPLHFWKVDGCSRLIIYIYWSKYWWRNVHRKIGAFSIRFVAFNSTLVYSVIWNQSSLMQVYAAIILLYVTIIHWNILMETYKIAILSLIDIGFSEFKVKSWIDFGLDCTRSQCVLLIRGIGVWCKRCNGDFVLEKKCFLYLCIGYIFMGYQTINIREWT